MKSNYTTPIVCSLIVILSLCVLCLCVSMLGGFAYLAFNNDNGFDAFSSNPGIASATPVVIRPTPQQTPLVPKNTLPAETPDSSSAQAEPPVTTTTNPNETLQTLQEAFIPINDLVNLAGRLEGKYNVVLTQEPPAHPSQVGDRRAFWVSNTDTNENFKVQAVLRYVTDHAYFWIEEGVSYEPGDLQDLAETFERQIYPTNREFFGSEWTPGVDSDPHIYILYATGIGNSIAGYFSSVDAYPPAVHEYSNWHEMFLFNANNVAFDEEFTYGVLAHEFQHMIHWYRDRNEDTWLNEGFSDLAMLLNGYDIGGHDYIYTQDPDVQLNDWPTDHNATLPHYGASFLFTTYFLDRFGDDATQALVAHPENGLESIDLLLQELQERDPLTGNIITADDVFLDWVLASYLQDNTIGDGRYTYNNYPDAPQPKYTESFSACTDGVETRDVRQYGVDYYRIRCGGSPTLHFEGSTLARVWPADPHSGDYAFWSNKSDESNMTLTRSFDFTAHSGDLTMNYWTWYDIEKDYDYVYVEASTDGETWQILNTPSGTGEDPSGNSFGWGYNGLSGTTSKFLNNATWIQEQVDLSQFAGQVVQIRFEYVTDAAVNGEGFLLDDISIEQIDYATDFENDDGGWQAAGFVRIQNALPQNYRLALIKISDETSVEYIQLTSDNLAEIPLVFDQSVDEYVLVVTGTTRYTRLPTAYRFYFSP